MTFERWRRLTEWPLAAAAAIFLGAYSWTVIANAPGPETVPLETAMVAVWVLFVVDYIVSFSLAKPRRRWFVTQFAT